MRLTRRAGLLAIAALIGSAAIARKPPPPVEIASAGGLIDDVNGYTLDAAGGVTRFEGLLIDRQGRVVRLLGRGEPRPPRLDFRLDAKGRALIPGLIEPRGHLLALGLAALPPAATPAAAQLPRRRDAALAAAQDLLLARGITGFVDLGTGGEDWNAYRRLGDEGRLRLRIVAYARGIETLLAVAGQGPTPWLYDGRLRMVGVALSADGTLDDAQLRNLMSRAAMDGFQVAAFAPTDAARRQVSGAIDELSLTYQGDRRWRTEPAPSDEIVDPAPFAVLATALAQGRPIAQALADQTTTAAKEAFAEDRIGSLQPGHQADFLLLDRDIMTASAAELRATHVLETWIGGARAWVRK